MAYGVWGLVDLVQKGLKGEKISPELELQIIEERLMSPSLSTAKAIEKLKLKCSKSNVQKVYSRWGLSKIRKAVAIRGVQACGPNTEAASEIRRRIEPSAKARFPNLIENARLKVNGSFSMLVKRLVCRSYSISNPGAIIAAPFLNQLGVIEALHTYGPETFKPVEITNDIVVNTLRIIVGFPTIHDYTLNSDRSVAIGAGLSLNPKKSRFYDSFDKLRFDHLQRLRNDASRRARELGIVEGREIAVDYHCDPSDSRYPADKSLSKSPDKKGDLVYAHRPQIIWDSATNTIVNIAYCEGRSRAPSALYKFCEENLFKIIDPDVVEEIYADSEYTGEKQIVYLTVRSKADVTMCLKQNPRIKKWKEETVGGRQMGGLRKAIPHREQGLRPGGNRQALPLHSKAKQGDRGNQMLRKHPHGPRRSQDPGFVPRALARGNRNKGSCGKLFSEQADGHFPRKSRSALLLRNAGEIDDGLLQIRPVHAALANPRRMGLRIVDDSNMHIQQPELPAEPPRIRGLADYVLGRRQSRDQAKTQGYAGQTKGKRTEPRAVVGKHRRSNFDQRPIR